MLVPRAGKIAHFCLGALMLCGCAMVGRPPEIPSLDDIGPAAGCELLATRAPKSTFVLYDTVTRRWVGCRPERARQQFLPASTFKVPHALIALETGVVTDPFELQPWDGLERRVAVWNRDTSLSSGLANSTVWFYQRTASLIGHREMQAWVERLDYGNRDVGPAAQLRSFWLDGALRISAVESVVFLDRLRRRYLPASRSGQDTVIAMMRIDGSASPRRTAWTLYAKSGAALPFDPLTGDLSDTATIRDRISPEQRVGWFVGWVARPRSAGGDQVFALNLDLATPGALGLREQLARQLLQANGVALQKAKR